jgi:uncharacterized protein YbjT (DUF2867 family)
MKIKTIITGTTGMVGEGVLHECLIHPDVEEVLVINRKPCGYSHPKLKEIIHKDFFDFAPIKDQLKGYNACFFCLGVSSVGMNEKDFNHLTYDLTMHVAETLVKLNPDMTFCYISGGGTDTSEKGKMMWARVKGKTENHLMNLGFKKAIMFRPSLIQPTKGMKNTLKAYKPLLWLIPILRAMMPKYVCSLREIGLAMINSVEKGQDKTILEVKDIVKLAAL